MTSSELIGVTGSTGRVGGPVAELLAAGADPIRLIVRDPSRAPAHSKVEVRQAAYGEHDASVRALAGVTTLLMVSATESRSDRRPQGLR